ncbi:SRPBCC family protein [Sphingobium chlorophenolicum]|nr:SRPBCC family protein [Sphingobium chlorophenolicum]
MSGDFAVIEVRATVARSPDAVWGLIGGFFDLGTFLGVECAPLSGDGGAGSVRIIAGAIVEPLVGATSRSYTYSQTAGPMAALHYHGTLACEQAEGGASEIVYTILYDQSPLGPDERVANRTRIEGRFGEVVEAMKRYCSVN